MSTSQSSGSLAGVWAKIDRAESQLLKLDKHVGRYLDSDPYGMRFQYDTDLNMFAYIIHVSAEPTLDIAVRFGDLVHNLRSALDHLAWQLVVAGGNTPRTEPPATQFPIYTESITRTGKPRIINIPPGVSGRMMGTLEGMQPYHRRDNPKLHPLGILQDLSNRDKHRTLNLTAAKLLDTKCHVINPHTGERYGRQFQTGVIQDQDVIGLFQLPPGITSLPDDWEIEGEGQSFVAFKEPGLESMAALGVAEDVLKYVRDIVIPAFQPFFN